MTYENSKNSIRAMKKSDMTIVQDTREQKPLTFPEAKVRVATLHTGDYSLDRFEDRITIKRKSLSDLLGSLGNDRDRFMREVLRKKVLVRYTNW